MIPRISLRQALADPALLGGVKTQMIGTTIYDQFGSGNNWPLGSAMSMLLMGFILVGVAVGVAVTAAVPELVVSPENSCRRSAAVVTLLRER